MRAFAEDGSAVRLQIHSQTSASRKDPTAISDMHSLLSRLVMIYGLGLHSVHRASTPHRYAQSKNTLHCHWLRTRLAIARQTCGLTLDSPTKLTLDRTMQCSLAALRRGPGGNCGAEQSYLVVGRGTEGSGTHAQSPGEPQPSHNQTLEHRQHRSHPAAPPFECLLG